MSMGIFTIRDLQHRAVRFTLVIIGATIVFSLVLLMAGMANFFNNEARRTVEAFGADAWLIPAGASGPFMSAATIDPEVATQLPGVGRADPLIISRATLRTDPPRETVAVGFPLDGIGLPAVVAGAPPRRGEIVVDVTTELRVGDQVPLAGRRFRVSGITEHTTLYAGLPLVFMGLRDAQELLFGGLPVATTIALRGSTELVPTAGLDVLTAEEVAAVTSEPLQQATSSVNFIAALLWIVSAMIIGGVVYLSSMERRRDFAVLKAVGSNTSSLLAGLAAQGLFIAITASLLASSLQLVLAPTFPLPVEVTTADLLRLPVIAVVVSLLASAAGMRRVARTDPALAFSGPGA